MIIYFLFNKVNGSFVGFSTDSKILNGSLLWKRLELEDNTNLMDITWEGNYETGRMVRKTEMPAEVSEHELKEKFYDRFFRRYPFEKFVEILLLQTQKDIDSNKIDKSSLEPDFLDMMNFFVKNYERLIEEIDFFKNSQKHSYISEKDCETRLKKQFEV